jgi:hypothetical protein
LDYNHLSERPVPMFLQKRSFGHMFAASGPQSRFCSERQNLPNPFSKIMRPFS